MILGFVIWSLMGLMIAGLGIHSLRSENAVGFFAGVEPPKVKDVKKYNKSVGVMWLVYATLLEICGIPLLYLEQNSAGFVLPILGTVLFTIALIIVYTLILNKNKA